MAPKASLKELLEAGVHFGHQTRKWNPKMRDYIFIARGGIHIIDLQKTLRLLEAGLAQLTKASASGQKVLFVATKKQARQPVAEAAASIGMPYVTERWLGGMLTNFQTVSQSIRKLEETEEKLSEGNRELLSKKEALQLDRLRIKLDRNLGGIRDLKKLPGALFVIDAAEEATAVKEANKLGIPVISVVDTNADPETVTFPIPGNDDAIRSIQLFVRLAKEAITEGQNQSSEGNKVVEAKAGESETKPAAVPAPEAKTKTAPATDA